MNDRSDRPAYVHRTSAIHRFTSPSILHRHQQRVIA